MLGSFGHSGLLYTLDTLIGEMRNRGYLWHIVMHRDWNCKHMAYYCNHERAVPGTWGTAIFFHDHGIFRTLRPGVPPSCRARILADAIQRR